MTEPPKAEAANLVRQGIEAAREVYPEEWWRQWTEAYLLGDWQATSMAEHVRKLVPQVHVDHIEGHQEGDPFSRTLDAYRRAEGKESWDNFTPEDWQRLARRVRAEHPDVIPDERTTRAAGARAAQEATWQAQWFSQGVPIDLAQYCRALAWVFAWVTEAKERLAAQG
jgi:hypothetical protein